jgi:hypothetical protein
MVRTIVIDEQQDDEWQRLFQAEKKRATKHCGHPERHVDGDATKPLKPRFITKEDLRRAVVEKYGRDLTADEAEEELRRIAREQEDTMTKRVDFPTLRERIVNRRDELKGSPDQPRDDHGRWTSGGEGDAPHEQTAKELVGKLEGARRQYSTPVGEGFRESFHNQEINSKTAEALDKHLTDAGYKKTEHTGAEGEKYTTYDKGEKGATIEHYGHFGEGWEDTHIASLEHLPKEEKPLPKLSSYQLERSAAGISMYGGIRDLNPLRIHTDNELSDLHKQLSSWKPQRGDKQMDKRTALGYIEDEQYRRKRGS